MAINDRLPVWLNIRYTNPENNGEDHEAGNDWRRKI